MIKQFTYSISEVIPYINWSYFFHAWMFPNNIVKKALEVGICKKDEGIKEVLELYSDALQMLQILDEKKYHTHSLFELLNASRNGDNIILQQPESKSQQMVFPCLRDEGHCLADFIDDKYNKIGIFASTIDGEIEKLYADDPYKSMLIKTLSDRLAEATAEYLHLQVRKTIWGYAQDEDLTIQQIHAEKFQGIRPAIGYPSLPDQSVIFILDQLLNLKDISISLTENGAMIPHASTCGLMINNPNAFYFSIKTLNETQLEDYALRRGMELKDIKHFLNKF